MDQRDDRDVSPLTNIPVHSEQGRMSQLILNEEIAGIPGHLLPDLWTDIINQVPCIRMLWYGNDLHLVPLPAKIVREKTIIQITPGQRSDITVNYESDPHALSRS